MTAEKTCYLFIDGGYLDKILDKYAEIFGVDKIPLNYVKIRGSFSKVFYYDCFPEKKKIEKDQNEDEKDYESRKKKEEENYNSKKEKKESFFNTLRSIDRFHVHTGTLKYRRKHHESNFEQKEIDVKIAVDMLIHTFKKNMDEATLLAGDLDYRPLIDALVQEGMNVTLWYECSCTNNELILSADNRRIIDYKTIYHLADNTFKDKFVLPNANFLKNMNSENRSELNKAKVIKNGKNEKGEIIEQKKLRNKYFYILTKEGENYFFEHTDQDFLERIIKYTEPNFKNIRWKKNYSAEVSRVG